LAGERKWERSASEERKKLKRRMRARTGREERR
jgi:hypothetical protein